MSAIGSIIKIAFFGAAGYALGGAIQKAAERRNAQKSLDLDNGNAAPADTPTGTPDAAAAMPVTAAHNGGSVSFAP